MDVQDLQAFVLGRVKSFLENDDHRILERRKYLASFIGCRHETVYRWTLDEQPPRGASLMKLWFVLRALGFTSNELDGLNPLVMYACELFSFGVISIDEVCDILQLKNDQQVWVTFRGKTSPVNRQKLKVKDLEELYGEQLAQAKLQVPEKFRKEVARIQGGEQPVPVKAQPSRATSRPSSEVRDTAWQDESQLPLLMLASQLKAASPLAEYVNSDACTDEMREKFREIFGHDAYEALFQTLASLRGKRAREFKKNGGVSRF